MDTIDTSNIQPTPYSWEKALGDPLTLIDASAGTGKTYTICERVVRAALAKELNLKDLALITFTRNAAQELRDRLRAFLTHPSSIGVTDFDTNQQREALAQLPNATIGTIHSFAFEIIAAIGTSGDTEPNRSLADTAESFAEIANDQMAAALRNPELSSILVRHQKVNTQTGKAPLSKTYSNIQSHLFDSYRALEHRDALQAWGSQIASNYLLQERLRGNMSNNTVLQIACKLLENDSAKCLVRSRWKWLIIDEFQDTDAVQWQIVKQGFLDATPSQSSRTRVILVGDPKQSIYRFRGADINNYKAAQAMVIAGMNRRCDNGCTDAHHNHHNQWYTLNTNYRSDWVVVEALNAINDQLFMGEGITSRPVKANKERRIDITSLLSETNVAEGHEDLAVGHDRYKYSDAGVVIRALQRGDDTDSEPDIPRDVALYVLRCLEEVEIEEPAKNDDEDAQWRDAQASDIAILVGTGRQCSQISRALQQIGIPSVIMRSTNVFCSEDSSSSSKASEAATAWMEVLQALNQPYQQRATHTASVGLLGYLQACDLLQSEVSDKISATWVKLQTILTTKGFAAFWHHLRSTHRIDERLLKKAQGDELLTDVIHIAELLCAQWNTTPYLKDLLTWLISEIHGSCENRQSDEGKRRLPTDQPAVKIMTYHGSKGLQFPIVLLPYILNPRGSKDKAQLTAYDSDSSSLVFYDDKADSSNPELIALQEQITAEEYAEQGRLAYVALTRAEMLAVIWQPTFTKWRSSFTPLQDLVLNKKPGKMDSKEINDTYIGMAGYTFAQKMAERCKAQDSGEFPSDWFGTSYVHFEVASALASNETYEHYQNSSSNAISNEIPACARYATAQTRLSLPQIRTSYSGITRRLTPLESDANETVSLPSSVYTHDEGDDDSRTLQNQADDVLASIQLTEWHKTSDADSSDLHTEWQPLSNESMPAQSGTSAAATNIINRCEELAASGAATPSRTSSLLRTAQQTSSTSQISSAEHMGSYDDVMTAEHFPMIEMPAGTSFGTCIHSAFEQLIHLRAHSCNQPLEDAVAHVGQMIHRQHDSLDSSLLTQAILQVYQTNLGPKIERLSLADIDPCSIRAELEFDFALHTSSGVQAFREICQAWREEIPKDDSVYGYAEVLEESINSNLSVLRGIMTGSIDVLARVNGSYYVMDWKTNRLSPYGQTPYLRHYDQAAVLHAMYHHDYLLQALIYSVAVYKMLTANGQPVTSKTLGGVAYLFVRGMNPAVRLNGDEPFAVFTWQPPCNLIKRVSQILNSATQ